MYDVYRKSQRRRLQTVDYLTYSHLPMLSEWEFQAFGPLGFCLETRQQPGCEVERGPFRNTTLITYLLSGELTVEAETVEDVQLTPRTFAVTVPRTGASISYRTGTEEASFIEIGLEILSEDGSASNRMGRVAVSGVPPGLDCLVSGQGHPDALDLSLDCAVYRAYLRTGENLIFETLLSRRLLLLSVRGTVRLEEDRLLPRDTALIRRVNSVPITAVQTAELLLLDMA